MMKQIKFFLATAILFGTCNLIYAQVPVIKKGTSVFSKPLEYKDPTATTVILTNSKTNPSDETWVVYADRDGVQGFKTPTSGEVLATYKFMDKFYVIEESGDKLHLISYEGAKILKKSLQEPVNDGGWVQKDKLLLWGSTLQTSNHIYLKALAVITDLSVLQGDIKKYMSDNEDSAGIRLFYSPTLASSSVIEDKSIRLFQWIFIAKIYSANKDTSYLLVRKNGFGPPSIDRLVLGWVSSKVITKWADCVCLEPNWDPEAVAERKSKGYKSQIFCDKSDAEAYSSGKNDVVSNLKWDDDPYEQKKDPQWKRFPILGRPEGQDLIQTGFVTPIYNVQGKQTLTVDQQATMEGTTSEKVLKQARQVNIVVVIDGSSDLQLYRSSIISAITKSTASLEDLNEYTFNYGAVIYRDGSMNNCQGLDMTVDPVNLTSNQSDMIDKLQSKLSSTLTCSDNNPKYQAINKGLMRGIKMFDDAKESNIIILIGSVSDNPDDLAGREEVIKKLADLHVTLVAFQAARGSDESEDFKADIRKIMIESTKKMEQSFTNKLNEKDYNLTVVEPKFTTQGRSIWYLKVPEASPVNDYILVPNVGDPMTPEKLSMALDSVFIRAYSYIELGIQQVTDKVSGIGEQSIEFTPLMKMYMSNIISSGIDPEIAKKYAADNFQFFMKGFTCMRPKGLKNDVYKYVLLMTKDEFNRITEILDKFNNSSGDLATLRSDVKSAYYEMVKTYYGPSIKDPSKLKASEINALVFHLPTNAKNKLFQYTLSDLEDVNKVSDEAIGSIAKQMTDSYSLLDQLSRDKRYSFRDFDIDFYWVPEEYLP